MPKSRGPIRSTLPEREIEICARLREMRLGLRLTQSEMAEQISSTRASVASYEDARVALKTGMALRICRQFIVSERWLATGCAYSKKNLSNHAPFSARDARMYVSLDEEKTAKSLHEDMLFSSAYDNQLAAEYERLYAQAPFQPRILLTEKDNVAAARNALSFLVDYWLPALETPEQRRLLFSLIRAGHLLDGELHETVLVTGPTTPLERIILEIFTNRDAFDDDPMLFLNRLAEKSNVDFVVTKDNIQGVKAQLPVLLKRLNEATRERGTKTALAKFMGVELPAVSRWLSGEKEPGGETTLRLLKWVEQQERQK